MKFTTGQDHRPTAVLLPGSGSDEAFVHAAFATALAAVGVELHAPSPTPGPELIRRFLLAMDRAAGKDKILVGGVSLGGHVAAEWALRNPDRCAGLLVTLPGWCGEPDSAPAALAARASAKSVRRLGLQPTLRAATEGVAPWLAEELNRSWPRYGDQLAVSLLAAAAHPAPSAGELAALDVPAGVVCCADDPVHPASVAEVWAKALPRAELRVITLSTLGADREALGRATVLAWLAAGGAAC